MTKANKKTSKRKSGCTVTIKPGQTCPHCGFAKLKLEPGNIIKCPVCGFGPNRRFT